MSSFAVTFRRPCDGDCETGCFTIWQPRSSGRWGSFELHIKSQPLQVLPDRDRGCSDRRIANRSIREIRRSNVGRFVHRSHPSRPVMCCHINPYDSRHATSSGFWLDITSGNAIVSSPESLTTWLGHGERVDVDSIHRHVARTCRSHRCVVFFSCSRQGAIHLSSPSTRSPFVSKYGP